MFRIDTPNRFVDLFGPGKPGFRDGDKALGINPTELSAAQQNALQEELAGVIEAAGVVLNKANNAQLLEALKRLIDAQSGNYALDTGAANAYVVALDPPISAYADGMTIRVKVANANTGASTLNAGAGAVPWVNDVGGALAGGDLPAGGIAAVTYIAAAGKFYTTSLVQSQGDARYAALAGLFSQVFSVGQATAAAHALRLDQQQVPFRNRIINGDMSVSQVNGGTAVTPTASGYISDQWRAAIGAASKLTFQQVADAPAGFKYSTKITVAAQYAPAASDSFLLQQPIEGQNIIDLGFGTANNRRIALGLQIKGSVAGTYAINLFNAAANRSYVGTIAVTNAWSPVVVTLDADSSGVWATDNTVGLWVSIDLGSGANFDAAAGAWQAGNYYRTAGSVTFVNQANGSTLNITGVQLEKVAAAATVGTDFEFLSFAEQLRRSQRYWEKSYDYPTSVGAQNASNNVISRVIASGNTTIVFPGAQYKVDKRANPTVTIWSGSNVAPTSGKISINGGSDSAGTAIASSSGMSGFTSVSGNTGLVDSSTYLYGWTSDARL